MRTTILVLSILLSPIAGAAEVPASQVTYVASWPAVVDVQMSATAIDPEGCSGGAPSQLYRIDLLNDSGAKEKHATLLTALASGRAIGLSISGCIGNSPKILGVRLYT